MRAVERGWWTTEVPDAAHGIDYGFRLDGSDRVRPDPRSPWQPHGVHGWSRTVDHSAFPWADDSWRGRPLAGSVLYELHIGTFTDEGTFDAAAAKLPYLGELGVDGVELLPVAAVPGRRSWGYDGVGLYAVNEEYGGPDGLKRFITAAHQHGIAVVLDVVHNHLGPSGNYLPEFGPYFGAGQNPWGAPVNLDGPGSDEVRRFVVDNALMWLRDYHLDGLRLDAVHALVDTRAVHVLEQMAEEVDALASSLGRPLWLIAESDLNDPRLIRAREAGGFGLTAQWCDDVHHALHATLTGERQGYYADFGSLPTLAKALTQAFVHDGSWSSFRARSHGRPVGDLPGERFVAFLQDHDQVGNRAQGDRLSATLSAGLLRVGAALLLGAPYTPMLFMGEEFGATTPWQFFSDLDSEALRRATSEGRRSEFAAHGWAPGDVPDPSEPETFTRSRLDWSAVDTGPDGLLAWYRRLIALRRAEPDLRDGRREHTTCSFDEDARTFVLRRRDLLVVCNLSCSEQTVTVDGTPVEVLAASATGFSYGPGLVTLAGESVVVVRRLAG
jgi:maltooligosyltrehalose trehalohydrolase